MEQGLNGFDEEQQLRPTLLTVLCILTFIGSSWLILTNIWAYATASKSSQMFSSVTRMKTNDSTFENDSAEARIVHKKRSLFGEKMMSSVSKMMTVNNIRKNAIGTIISSILTLFAALMMWQQKKSGFYIYIIGTLCGIMIPFYLYGANMMSIGVAFVTGFFGLVFIALYALNIKSLR